MHRHFTRWGETNQSTRRNDKNCYICLSVEATHLFIFYLGSFSIWWPKNYFWPLKFHSTRYIQCYSDDKLWAVLRNVKIKANHTTNMNQPLREHIMIGKIEFNWAVKKIIIKNWFTKVENYRDWADESGSDDFEKRKKVLKSFVPHTWVKIFSRKL